MIKQPSQGAAGPSSRNYTEFIKVGIFGETGPRISRDYYSRALFEEFMI